MAFGRKKPPRELDLSRSTTVRLRAPQKPRPLRPAHERVVLWLPAVGQHTAGETCLDWCHRRGYEVVGVVVDDGNPGRWQDVVTMVVSAEADVILAADLAHFPPERRPRTEAVEQVREMAPPPPPRQRRGRTVRRPQK